MQYLEFNKSTPNWGYQYYPTPDWKYQYFSYKPYIIDAITETNPSKDLKEAVNKIFKTIDKLPDLFLKAEHLNDYDQFTTLISKIVSKKNTNEIDPCLLKIFNRLIALQESDLNILEKTLIPISQTWAKYISIIKSEKKEPITTSERKDPITTMQSYIREYNKRHTVFLPSELLPLLDVPVLSKYTPEEKRGIAKALCIQTNLLLSDLGNNGKSIRIEKNAEKYTHVVRTNDPICHLFQALHSEIKQATANPQEYFAELPQDILKTQPFINYKKVGIDVPKFLCLEMIKLINKFTVDSRRRYYMRESVSDLSTEYDYDMSKTTKFLKLNRIQKCDLNFSYRYHISEDKKFITLIVDEGHLCPKTHFCKRSKFEMSHTMSVFRFKIKELKQRLIFEEKNIFGRTERKIIKKTIEPFEITLKTFELEKNAGFPNHKVAICPDLDCWIEFSKDRGFVTLTLIDNEVAGKGACRINFPASSVNIPIFTDAKVFHNQTLITRVRDPHSFHQILTLKNGTRKLNTMLEVANKKGGKIVDSSRNRLPDINGKDNTREIPFEQLREWYPGTLFDVVMKVPFKIGSEQKPLPYDIHRLLCFYLDIVETMIPQHSLGIIHRDLKPENILIKTDGEKAEAYLNDVDLVAQFGMGDSYEYPYWDQSTRIGYMTPFSDSYTLAVSLISMIFKTGLNLDQYFDDRYILSNKIILMRKEMKKVIHKSMLDDDQKACLIQHFSNDFNFSSTDIDLFSEKFDPQNFEEKTFKEIKKIMLTTKAYSEVFDLAHKIFLSSLEFDNFIENNEFFKKIWKNGTIKQKLAEIEKIQNDYLFMPQIAKELKRILGIF